MSKAPVKFGTSDHRFFGVTIDFEDREDFEFFRGVYSKEITPLMLQRQRASENFPEHRLWVATSFEHEMRHFHDGILSPHWLGMLNLRHQNILNSFSLQALVVECARFGNCLPLPMRKWLRLNEIERRRRIATWPRKTSEASFAWNPIPMPVLDDKDNVLNKVASATFWPPLPEEARQIEGRGVAFAATSIMGYDRIEKLLIGKLGSGCIRDLSPRNAYEFSAILVQLASAHLTFGEDAMNDLKRSMQKHANLDYGSVLTIGLNHVSKSPSMKPESVLSVCAAAAMWALLGPPDLTNDQCGRARSAREIDFSCPGYRLSHALRYIYETRLVSTTPADVLKELDASSKTLPVSTALEWGSEMMSKREENLTELAADENYTKYIEPLLAIVRAINQRKAFMDKRFTKNPNTYIDPMQYLQGADSWGLPTLRFETNFDHPSMAFNIETDPRDQGVFRWEQNEAGEYHGRSNIVALRDEVNPRLLFDYEMRHLETDYLNTGQVLLRDVSSFREALEKELDLVTFMV